MGPYNGQHQLFKGGFTAGPTITIGTPVLATGGTNGLWVDGAFQGNGPGTDGPGGLFIGYGDPGLFGENAASDVAIVLAFNTQLTDDERVGVEFRIAQEYGLTGFSANAAQLTAGDAQLNGFLTVPEPSAIALLGLSSLALIRRRRK